MPRRKILNVKKHLEHLSDVIDFMLKDNDMHGNNGLHLPPAYEDELRKLGIINRAILTHHEKKNTRKDIYVETGR